MKKTNSPNICNETYYLHPSIMNDFCEYVKNLPNSLEIEQEKTKQIVEPEKTKQIVEQEKTKQIVEQEKTKQEQEKTKQLQLQLELKKLELGIRD
jgi:tyrosyl-tRNA synthetase